MNKLIYILLLLFLSSSCKKEKMNDDYELVYPEGFPTMNIPSDNQLSKSRVMLGKMLFFDKRLSEDSTVSCASCHLQNNSFADNEILSPGVHGSFGFRNSPSLANIGYATSFFMDGGVPTLELQVLSPIENPVEMNLPIPEAVARMALDPHYQKAAQKAYGRDFDAFVLTRAIASFERTLISGDSRFDQYFYQGKEVLNQSEKNGYQLFLDNNCASCHSGSNFTDYQFHNIGLYINYADNGRKRVTTLTEDDGKFKTPSLRNIELTAPYMHDGSFANLEDVVDFLATGGEIHPNKSSLIQPMNLTQVEKTDLINFLKSLTDAAFISNPEFQ